MIDIKYVRDEPDATKAALARRGVKATHVDFLLDLDAKSRLALGVNEALRAQVKALSKKVGEAHKVGNKKEAEALRGESKALGEKEHQAGIEAEKAAQRLREALLLTPNLPSNDAPNGTGPKDNPTVATWHLGQDDGLDAAPIRDCQRVPHWEIGTELGILDMESGAKLAGSMFPLFRGMGARLVRAMTTYALTAHQDDYEEIRPPTLVLTETITSTGHLPKFANEAYHVERDDLWLIPTAEVPLTSMHRDNVIAEADLPIKMCAVTACFRREAGAAGRDTRGLLRVHEFDKVELFAYTTPDQAHDVQRDIVLRAERLLRDFGLTYRVLDLCAGDLGTSSARTFDLEVYAPGCNQWLEVSSVSWFRDYQARRANVRYRSSSSADGRGTQFVHTVNGSGLAWPRIWAAIVENGRMEDGSVRVPNVLVDLMGVEVIEPRSL